MRRKEKFIFCLFWHRFCYFSSLRSVGLWVLCFVRIFLEHKVEVERGSIRVDTTERVDELNWNQFARVENVWKKTEAARIGRAAVSRLVFMIGRTRAMSGQMIPMISSVLFLSFFFISHPTIPSSHPSSFSAVHLFFWNLLFVLNFTLVRREISFIFQCCCIYYSKGMAGERKKVMFRLFTFFAFIKRPFYVAAACSLSGYLLDGEREGKSEVSDFWIFFPLLILILLWCCCCLLSALLPFFLKNGE